MKIEPHSFTDTLKAQLGDQLRAVILYGSSVGGDFVAKRSDHNLLVVVRQLDFATLRQLREPFTRWVKGGQRAPLLFTADRLQRSADVFPIELYDLRDRREVLHGEDVIARLELTPKNLRLQLESELKGKLIALREGYFACEGKPKALTELVVASLSNFQVLMRAALRLHELEIPAEKDAVVDLLATCFPFDTAIFHRAAQIKSGHVSARSVDGEQLFAQYLAAVEQLVDAVDAHQV